MVHISCWQIISCFVAVWILYIKLSDNWTVIAHWNLKFGLFSQKFQMLVLWHEMYNEHGPSVVAGCRLVTCHCCCPQWDLHLCNSFAALRSVDWWPGTRSTTCCVCRRQSEDTCSMTGSRSVHAADWMHRHNTVGGVTTHLDNLEKSAWNFTLVTEKSRKLWFACGVLPQLW